MSCCCTKCADEAAHVLQQIGYYSSICVSAPIADRSIAIIMLTPNIMCVAPSLFLVLRGLNM